MKTNVIFPDDKDKEPTECAACGFEYNYEKKCIDCGECIE